MPIYNTTRAQKIVSLGMCQTGMIREYEEMASYLYGDKRTLSNSRNVNKTMRLFYHSNDV